MHSTEITCPQRRNKFWQTKSKPSLRSSPPEECVVKVVKENLEENVRKTTYVSKAPNVTLRNTCGPTFVSMHASGKWKDIARRGTLTQLNQRVASGRTRNLQRQAVHTKNSRILKHDAQSSQTQHSITRDVIKNMYKMSILDRFQIIQ